MNAYRLTVAYDGTAYWGWQQQPNGPTVAGALERGYKRAFGHEITLLGASRTDAGVHALGQVARFYSPLEIEYDRLVNAWNGVLPGDIKIRSVERVADDFHPHKGVAHKTYYYHIFTQRPLPFLARYGYLFPYPLDQNKLQSALALFEGQHNFWTFKVEGGAAPSDLCTINQVGCEEFKRLNMLRISVTGNRFLYHMVRRMAGAAIIIAASPRRSVNEIPDALNMQTSRNRFPTAPAQGLVLRKIVYKKEGVVS
jgi:tRNA pseudouridine38-40 synthase